MKLPIAVVRTPGERLRGALAHVGETASCSAVGSPALAEAPLSIAVIGTRSASEDACQAVAMGVATLVRSESALIVSGGAVGIDSAAHRAAIEAGGATAIALTHGFHAANEGMEWYRLWRTAPERVLLLSLFPAGQRTSRRTPVVRNRLVAGLADAVLAGEARPTSGTMHTVKAALERGTPVFLERTLSTDGALVSSQRSLAALGAILFERDELHGDQLPLRIAAAALAFRAQVTESAQRQHDLFGGERP